MMMALQGNTLRIKGADNVQFTVIKSWNKMRWVKKLQELQGTADLELLDLLAGLVRLPPAIEQRRWSLRAVQNAVDRERVNQASEPLYAHQTRGPTWPLSPLGGYRPKGAGRHERPKRGMAGHSRI